MTHEELLKLYGLRGMIKGLMGGAKAELRANHKVRPIYHEPRHHHWLDGRNEVAVENLRNLNHLRRELCRIISEVENA
jgi:hypothetical protein